MRAKAATILALVVMPKLCAVDERARHLVRDGLYIKRSNMSDGWTLSALITANGVVQLALPMLRD
jgi:hypothetical protein